MEAMLNRDNYQKSTHGAGQGRLILPQNSNLATITQLQSQEKSLIRWPKSWESKEFSIAGEFAGPFNYFVKF
jgi:hypothetical protein